MSEHRVRKGRPELADLAAATASLDRTASDLLRGMASLGSEISEQSLVRHRYDNNNKVSAYGHG